MPSRNKARAAAYMREWRAKNREHIRAYKRGIYKPTARCNRAPDIAPMPPLSPEKVLSHASLNVRKWKAWAFERLGKKCVRCGFDDIRALQIDHVNGGGRKERTRIFCNSPRRFYRAVAEDREGKYQTLCANCNQIKRAEEGE